MLTGAACTRSWPQEMESGPTTFQPGVNRRSVQLAQHKLQKEAPELASLPAGERLYLRAMNSPRR